MVYRLHVTSYWPRTLLALVGLAIGLISAQTAYGQQAAFNPPYPRIASRPHGTFLNSATTDADARHIAKHHIAILATHRTWSGGGFDMASISTHIKSYNPSIKLIKYTNANQLGNAASGPASESWMRDKLSRERGGGGRGDWWKRTTTGANITGFQADKWQINATLQTTPDAAGLRYVQWFARYWDAAPTESGDWVAPAGFNKGRGLSEGKWDGIFADSQYVSKSQFAPSNADYNNDGVNDAPTDTTTMSWVVKGQTAYKDAWKALHPNWIFLGQFGGLTAASEIHADLMKGVYDGGLIQDISKKDGQGAGWSVTMASYRKGMSIATGPKIVIFHNKIQEYIDDNPTITSVYRWNRYGMCSALMDNGYYAVMAPGDIYPEYDEFWGGSSHSASNLGYLGYPVDPPQTAAWSQGVYRREFDKGLVLLNPKGNGTRTVNVGEGWKRLLGQQDPVHNNGKAVTSITLNEQDGIILVRANSTPPPNPPELFPPE